MTKVEPSQRLHYLDGLRALACLLILFHHSITASICKVFNYAGLQFISFYFSSFTESGVEIFFILSGILLLRPYFRYDRAFNSSLYYKRRLERLYPPYFFAVLFAAAVIAINTYFPSWYSIILLKFSWSGFIRQFLLFNFVGDYYNLAWWSLQVEVLFYLLIPVLVKYCKFNKVLLMIIVVAALSLMLQVLLSSVLPQFYSTTSVLLTPFRFVEYMMCFLFGIFLAKYDFSFKKIYQVVAVGLVLMIVGYFYIPLIHMAYAFLYFGVFISIQYSEKIQGFLSKPILVWIGERSYSLFLTHFSVFYLTNYLVSNFVEDRSLIYGLLTRTIGLLLSFFIAMLLFHFIERMQARGLQTAHQFWPPLFRKK